MKKQTLFSLPVAPKLTVFILLLRLCVAFLSNFDLFSLLSFYSPPKPKKLVSEYPTFHQNFILKTHLYMF